MSAQDCVSLHQQDSCRTAIRWKLRDMGISCTVQAAFFMSVANTISIRGPQLHIIQQCRFRSQLPFSRQSVAIFHLVTTVTFQYTASIIAHNSSLSRPCQVSRIPVRSHQIMSSLSYPSLIVSQSLMSGSCSMAVAPSMPCCCCAVLLVFVCV